MLFNEGGEFAVKFGVCVVDFGEGVCEMFYLLDVTLLDVLKEL